MTLNADCGDDGGASPRQGLLFKVNGVSSSSPSYAALSNVMLLLCIAFLVCWAAVVVREIVVKFPTMDEIKVRVRRYSAWRGDGVNGTTHKPTPGVVSRRRSTLRYAKRGSVVGGSASSGADSVLPPVARPAGDDLCDVAVSGEGVKEDSRHVHPTSALFGADNDDHRDGLPSSVVSKYPDGVDRGVTTVFTVNPLQSRVRASAAVSSATAAAKSSSPLLPPSQSSTRTWQRSPKSLQPTASGGSGGGSDDGAVADDVTVSLSQPPVSADKGVKSSGLSLRTSRSDRVSFATRTMVGVVAQSSAGPPVQ